MSRKDPATARFLSSLRHKVLREGRLSVPHVRSLMRLCAHPSEPYGEAALLLLLHPPLEDELAYLVDLLVAHHHRLPLLPPKLQVALFELACDLVATLRGLPQEATLRAGLEHLLRRCTRAAAQRLLAGRFLLHDFGDRIVQQLLVFGFGKRTAPSRRKIRCLLKRCQRPVAAWAAPTTADLAALWSNLRARRRQRLTPARWLKVCRAITAPAENGCRAHAHSQAHPSGTHERQGARSARPATRLTYWGGYGPLSLRYLERLIELQEQEIRAQRKLAHRVGTRTGRVVLSLHNATLAAMGGWGFEPLVEAFPDQRRREAFAGRALTEAAQIADRERQPGNGLDAILNSRQNRLIQPRWMHVMVEMELCSRLDDRLHPEAHRIRDMAADLAMSTSGNDVSGMTGIHRATLQGAVAPHQRQEPSDLSAWASAQRRLWKPGFIRLAALLSQGQAALDRGEVASFTVPWIDKFFISSRRDKDLAYLPALLHWLASRGIHPLVLFWEDTAHASEPSFQLGLARMIAAGSRFRGIGVFGNDGSRRADAERIIVEEHEATSLFALRPWVDTHLPCSFHQLLRKLDPRPFSSYDSSWKDNLAFLYFGTQVSRLLSPQTEMEAFSPWVIVEGRKRPFGTHLRQMLRRMLLGETLPQPDAFWSDYLSWANLG